MVNWFKESFAQIGPKATFYYILDAILRRTHIGSLHNYIFYAQPLKAIKQSPNRRFQYTIKELSPGAECLSDLLPDAVLDFRFGQKSTCVGAFKEGELAALLWFTTRRYNEDEVRATFHLPKNSAWDYGIHVVEKFRMTRAFLELWSRSAAIMIKKNISTSISRISAFNGASVKSHQRLGAFKIGSAVFIKIWFLQLTFSNIKPYVHISFGPKYIPDFYLTVNQSF